MSPEDFLTILQISDTLFPTGGFAYSDGLESAVANGIVSDPLSLERWLQNYITGIFLPCEGLAIKLAMTANPETLRKLDEELTAIKPAASVRASSSSLGRRFLSTISRLHKLPQIEFENFPVVYGAVAGQLGFGPQETLLAFAYNRLAATTSAALRLMPIGQHQAHAALTRLLKDVPAAVEDILNDNRDEVTCFAPLLDIQQMNHRYLYSRLFRS